MLILSGGVLLDIYLLPGMVSDHFLTLVFIFGIILVFRCFLWFALATDLPEQHPRVSPKVIVGMDVIMVHATFLE